MPTLRDLIAHLDAFAPPALAEPWDNVGLLLGDRDADARGVLTCLTLTPDVAAEAIRGGCGLIVTHHPILFKAVQRLTADTADGTMLLALIRAGIAVYSPHTAFDGTAGGINDQLAARLGLRDVRPLRPAPADSGLPGDYGSGRHGERPVAGPFAGFVTQLRATLALPTVQVVATERMVQRVAVACGSAAEFLPDAVRLGCDVLVTGEARFHAALEARAAGIGLILVGHYASERFAVETLADRLAAAFPGLPVSASRAERDPLAWA